MGGDLFLPYKALFQRLSSSLFPTNFLVKGEKEKNYFSGDSLRIPKFFGGSIPIRKDFLGNHGPNSLIPNLSHSNCLPDTVLKDSEGRTDLPT